MIVPYTELPGGGGLPRPILDVSVAGLDDATFPCLTDTGSINSLLPVWIAEEAGLALGELEARPLGVGGMATEARFVPVRLTAVGHSWEAEVGFTDPWPYDWGLLGQLSFFRYFVVTFRAADFQLEVVPVGS